MAVTADWMNTAYVTLFCNGYTKSGIQVYQNPQAQAWGYTDKARLRGLRSKTTFKLRIWY
jgi:hypothetical protein